jgi:putative heme-binding domain-containing protein
MKVGYSMSGEDRMLALLEAGKVPRELIPSAVEGMKGAWRKMVYEKAKTYLPGYIKPQADQAEQVFADIASLKGDAVKGKTVFKNICSVCHQAEGMGQNFGPALSEIGSKLPKESLLDAIVHPSAGISFGYETSVLNMKDGSTYTGIISSRTETDIELKLPGGTVQKIKTADIKNTSQTKESMMPALHSALSKQDMADLLEYLTALKKKN